ncbi:DUF6286 domain-containing protein [Actinomadura rudentiformis]|uniref:DUF6286 domain-containing protein n=1 Tax=Actinomadura rudentiformis TaxID=359158 RepID=A0A6H9YYQ7_9ACTN|nr:DUF6286 domain-containing protein [Actinomadura rudentiformis]KAB2347011.1 hypothetical protein F8566_22825 [Actinomadura rudentiformis]
MTTAAGRLPKASDRTEAPPKSADRAARRAARRVFRPRRVWPALVAATTLTVAGTIVAIETISALAGSPAGVIPYERLADRLARTGWRSTAVIAAGAVALLLGLAALLAGLLPGHTKLIRLRTDDPDLVMGVTGRGLRTAAATAARDVDLVSDVHRVKARRNRVIVTVVTPVRDTGELKEKVRDAVRARFDELGVDPPRTVGVRVRRKGA